MEHGHGDAHGHGHGHKHRHGDRPVGCPFCGYRVGELIRGMGPRRGDQSTNQSTNQSNPIFYHHSSHHPYSPPTTQHPTPQSHHVLLHHHLQTPSPLSLNPTSSIPLPNLPLPPPSSYEIIHRCCSILPSRDISSSFEWVTDAGGDEWERGRIGRGG